MTERRSSPGSAGSIVRSALVLVTLALVALLVAACVSVDQTPAPDGTSAPSSALPAEASPTPITFVTPTPEPTPLPTPEPVAAEVLGFLPNWQLEQALMALDTDLLTMVALHGVEASGNGRLVSKKPSGDVPGGWQVLESDEFTQLARDLQADGVKVLLTVQRFGWSEGTAERTANLLNDQKDRRRLAGQIARLVEERGLDGVNLDFEPIPQALSDEYVELVREVRAALDEVDASLHLSVDVVASLSGYDLAALTADGAADLAVIMGYNYRGPGYGSSGSIAPLADEEAGGLTATLDEALAQVSADKLMLALPWYGRTWSTESPDARSATRSGRDIPSAADVAYADAVEIAAASGRRYQPDQASAWTAYPDRDCPTCPPVWRQLWYDDPESFGTKLDLAFGRGLAGVGLWALGHEAGREDLWWTLRDRLRPQDDVAPPNGSASIDGEAVIGEREGLDLVEGSAPLRLFAADDTAGSGLAYVRIGLSDEREGDGRLTTARTYPAVGSILVPLGDEATGGSAESGPRSIHVQWQDIAGNWSAPVVIETWVVDPATFPTPDDL